VASAAGDPASAADAVTTSPAAVPGGADALPDVLRRAPVDPPFALVSLVVAAALGAGHALTPGHGKTLMAAYLVGVRGTRRHALGLGLTVSVTHTIGILVLAMVVLAAESALPADLVVRVAPVVAAGSIVVVGSWMLLGELRRRSATRRSASTAPDHDHAHRHADDHAHDHRHAHDHDHDHVHAPGSEPHSHGLVTHRHVPVGDGPMRWRSLALLGLAGGLIPSANALLILLGTIAAGRPAWGVVLVGAFGLGMAGVMAGLGLVVVQARSLLDRAPGSLPFAAGRRLIPLGASLVVLAFGLVLSVEAIGAARLG
jgi:ABC-type nickel/cobalt efflux system permease component RcnA